MKVIITYYSDQIRFSASLIMLQCQTVLPEEIIVMDTSKDKSGAKIAQTLCFNNVPIKVICYQQQIYYAWNRGIKEAGNSDVLILNDDLIFPLNFIEQIEKTKNRRKAYCYVPVTSPREHCSPIITADIAVNSQDIYQVALNVDWMPGFCFFLTKECIKDVGLINTDYQVWFGDTDYEERIKKKAKETGKIGIIRLENVFVYHYGGKSYDYCSSEVREKIDIDRELFINQHKNEKK
jgi:YHS domain-containing protein